MKKYLLALALLALPFALYASPVSVNRLDNNHIEPLNKADFIRATYFTATSTSATSTFPNASVTTAFNFLGSYITNVSTWFNGLFDTQLATKSTTNLAEGTNLYYTLARWASALAGTTTDALPQGVTNLYNQTHTGEVTGATSLTVADDIIDEANLKVNAASDGYLLSASSTASGGLAWLQVITDFLTFGDGLTRTANDVDCDTANGSTFGCLTSADWTTFNGKQAAGNYITALTGDVTASGPGSVAATLATVNGNVGTFGSATQAPQVTVNGKGLVTAASNVTVTPAVGSITGLGTGVGTFLATPSSANLDAAVTDDTGSGALVFATSPTLVTPALGTPSSGTVTNLTGTASININGTVGATTPTTGAFTTLTASGTTTTGVLVASNTDSTGAPDWNLSAISSTGKLIQYPETACNGGGGTFFQQVFSGQLYCAVVNLGSSDITGTLPVARGGTGITSLGSGIATWLGTPSSANLDAAVTDDTGSGALTFATSPTFTTDITAPTIYGSSASGGDLAIQSTSHATDGVITIGDGETSGQIGIGGTNAAGTGLYFYKDWSSNDASATAIQFYPIFETTTTGRTAVSIGAQLRPAAAVAQATGFGTLIQFGAAATQNTSSWNVTTLTGNQIRVDELSGYTGTVGTLNVQNIAAGVKGGTGTFTTMNVLNIPAGHGTFGAANVRGIKSAIAASSTAPTANYNLYVDGTAPNYLAGQVGIGTASPDSPLMVQGTDNGTASNVYIPVSNANCTASDLFMKFTTTAGTIGSIACTATAGLVAYNTFTGSHWTIIDDMTDIWPNALLLATGESVPDRDYLSKAELSCEEGSKRAYGVFGGTNDEGYSQVLSIGTGKMWVANEGEDLEVGDLLMSSDLCGHVEKQHGFFGKFHTEKTVAKVMTDVVWEEGERDREVGVVYFGG